MDKNTYQVIIEEQVEDQIQRIVNYLIKEVSLQTAEYVRADYQRAELYAYHS